MGYDRIEGTHVVVTGGAGFLGSHLCTRLLERGARVTAIDNLITGRAVNLEHLLGNPEFRFVHHDVTDYLHVPGPVDAILHFASPASPIDYLELPIQTLKVGALGTHKALGLARATGATLLLASTSEVYGDPQVHPQPETYWGHVNPIGPRGVYDEAKRFAEAMTYAYHRTHDVDVRVVRIFNSVLADEQVLYDDGTELRRETFRQLAERIGHRAALDGVRVPAVDREGTAHIRETIALEGHPPTGACFEIRTRYGRSIKVTGDHSLFTCGRDDELVATPVSELSVGDHVAISSRIEVPVRDRTSFDVLEAAVSDGTDPWDLRVTFAGLVDVVHERRTEMVDVLQRRATERGTSTQRRPLWAAIDRWKRGGAVPGGLLDELGVAVPDDASIAPRTSGRSNALPRRLMLTDEFLWFLGLFVAEGCWQDAAPKSRCIHVSCEQEVLDRADKILRRELGVHVVRTAASDARAGSLVVHGTLLLQMLRHLGFDGGAKRIPGWILGLPLERLGWFLEGYREGDGVHSGDTFRTQERHEFSTTSAHLKDDLIVAFARFGLVPSVGEYHTRNTATDAPEVRRPFWRLTLAQVAPWSPLDWHRGVAQKLNARRSGDVVWARVQAIDEVAPTEQVYDFSVPGAENFWAGDGFVAHNTYGERMRLHDGRAVPAFIGQALAGAPITLHGDGSQTRSLCYVDDLVEGILRLLVSGYTDPVNVGSPEEVTILALAETIRDVVGSDSPIITTPRPVDDPEVRQPDLTVAERELGWRAEVSLREGLERTVAWYRQQPGARPGPERT
ncbi:MAG: NAD-dependent epimerase/dehydratase family protein [Nitriliruptor sp.]